MEPPARAFALMYPIDPDDGGHDVIDKFEFPCNSMEILTSI